VIPSVRVRMYRQGLGDCFLVTFDLGGDERHVLFDCGTLGATTTGVKLAEVVADIRKTTKDHLHLVIATHEHWDHLAGFAWLDQEFLKIHVDHVWLAWTEDPENPLAQQLARNKKDLAAALVAASRALTSAAMTEESAALGRFVQDLLGFYGDIGALGASSDIAEQLNNAMAFVRTKLGVTAEYRHPGERPLEEDWLPGFRVYVLGPPENEAALQDVGASGSSELYGLTVGLRGRAAALAPRAADPRAAAATPSSREFEAELPFAPHFRRPFEQNEAALRDYYEESAAWRRIDEDWLRVTSGLALQLDNLTNNTSLALAIERIADGKVLLFPADAQQGNWLSWHDPKMKWTGATRAGGKTITAKQLLGRTVFYKVGHHSSHNATAKAKGLELMEAEEELTAFIPVDRAVALKRNPQGAWKMPARPLYRRLLEKCHGRVARSDLGWADDAAIADNPAVEQEFVDLATAAEWTTWRAAQQAATNVQVGKLFIDYVLK
jgi:hypothetical protein